MNELIIVPTYEVTFERTSRRGFYIVTLDDTKRYVPSRLFYAVFPQMNRKVTSGNVEVSGRQLEALGIIADILDNNRYQIRYTARFSYDRTGRISAVNYEVTALSLGQTIAIVPAAFLRITGASERTTDGCMDVSAAQIDELGFIRKEVAISASSAILSA